MGSFCISLMLVTVLFHLSSSAFTKEDCDKPVEVGPMQCRAAILVFRWHNNQCEEAIYGGCYPSKNNFKSKKECEKVAGPICSKKKY
ncbi:kappaPI-actitoxin-Avd3c-like [Harmonia axyridis]|uniref:kappaPI-actitoxin-Avd3c-like n=1 Tax=Harmonia axyridis TaxID=115357 RepID=UPI001E2791CF|nr:kappaPI-actitoxin-Avd3c-like [Harmonia axyridis]